MKQKRIIAMVLAVSMLFSAFSVTGDVCDFRRTVEGYAEIAIREIRNIFGVRSYSHYEELCGIPETENGYVPQGYCYSESEGLHFVSYYHDEKASVISIVDASSGEKIKTLSLKKINGKDFTGHAGGIAEDGTYLYAGEFYTFTTGSSYDTDKSHHMSISLFETTYSRCNAYLLSDISSAFSADGDEIAVPSMIFTTPNCVQGFARLNDGSFALSISYGRKNNSSLSFYEDVTKNECDFAVDYSGVSVPAYHLKNSFKTEDMRQPPLLEGIDDMNGKVTGIFESCAEKYSDAAFIVDKICIFK